MLNPTIPRSSSSSARNAVTLFPPLEMSGGSKPREPIGRQQQRDHLQARIRGAGARLFLPRRRRCPAACAPWGASASGRARVPAARGRRRAGFLRSRSYRTWRTAVVRISRSRRSVRPVHKPTPGRPCAARTVSRRKAADKSAYSTRNPSFRRAARAPPPGDGHHMDTTADSVVSYESAKSLKTHHVRP